MSLRQALRPLRFTSIFVCMCFFLAQMSIIWLLVRGHWARVRWSNRILKPYCQFGLWLLNVKVDPLGLENLEGLNGAFFVGNHLSYIDVLVIHSILPACFVTSREVRETPVLGQVCALAGCLFVERRNRRRLLDEVEEITSGLREHFNVVVFPEATSTNGEQILRFKRPLFMSALKAKCEVVPFCLNYRKVGEKPINTRSRDTIFWYGDMGFAGHLWALAGNGGVRVELNFMEPIRATPEADVSWLTQKAQAEVDRVFIPVTVAQPATVPVSES